MLKVEDLMVKGLLKEVTRLQPPINLLHGIVKGHEPELALLLLKEEDPVGETPDVPLELQRLQLGIVTVLQVLDDVPKAIWVPVEILPKIKVQILVDHLHHQLRQGRHVLKGMTQV